MASRTKRKHSETFNCKELYDLVDKYYFDEKKLEWFDSIRQWLNTNKDDQDRLKAALTYQTSLKVTPLHLILRKGPSLDIIQIIINYAPEVLQMKTLDGRLPIHYACWHLASLEIIQALITASPESTKLEDNYGLLPFHKVCSNGASLDILDLLIKSYPEGKDHKALDYLKQKKYAEKMDDNGMFSLHHACKNGYSDHLIHLLILANPECYKMNDDDGRTPLDYYTSLQGRLPCNEIVTLLQPLNKRKSKNPVVSPELVPITARNAEAPRVAPIENQPVAQMADQNEVEIKNAGINDLKAEIKSELKAEIKAEVIGELQRFLTSRGWVSG